MTWQKKNDMTLISPCAGLGNSHPRKGHSRGEPFPPFSNSVGMEIERAWGNFTINQSSASLLRKAKGKAGSQMTNPFSSRSWNYCWRCDARSQGNPHGIPAHWLLITPCSLRASQTSSGTFEANNWDINMSLSNLCLESRKKRALNTQKWSNWRFENVWSQPVYFTMKKCVCVCVCVCGGGGTWHYILLGCCGKSKKAMTPWFIFTGIHNEISLFLIVTCLRLQINHGCGGLTFVLEISQKRRLRTIKHQIAASLPPHPIPSLPFPASGGKAVTSHLSG